MRIKRVSRTIAYKFFWVVVCVTFLRGCVVENFRVQDKTMEPEVPVGSIVWVSKLSYGLRIPLVGAILYDRQNIKLNDLILLAGVGDPPKTIVRRVAWLPGSTVPTPDGYESIVLKKKQYFVVLHNGEANFDRLNESKINRKNIVGRVVSVWMPERSMLGLLRQTKEVFLHLL